MTIRKILNVQITFELPDRFDDGAFDRTTAADIHEALCRAYPLCDGGWIKVEDMAAQGGRWEDGRCKSCNAIECGCACSREHIEPDLRERVRTRFPEIAHLVDHHVLHTACAPDETLSEWRARVKAAIIEDQDRKGQELKIKAYYADSQAERPEAADIFGRVDMSVKACLQRRQALQDSDELDSDVPIDAGHNWGRR